MVISMPFTKWYNSHTQYTSTRKSPELKIHNTINGSESFYIKSISEAIYLVVQLPNGGSNIKIKCYQALSKDGSSDDTTETTSFNLNGNARIQESDLVLTMAPYLKVTIETQYPTEIKIWIDYV